MGDIGAIILLLAIVGALIGVFGRRSILARRIGAGLIALDVLQRLLSFMMNVAGGALKTSTAGQVIGSLFWALIEILLIMKFWKVSKPPTS